MNNVNNTTAKTNIKSYWLLHGFQYYDKVLQFFHISTPLNAGTSEGYVKNTPTTGGASSFDYVYQYKDHLGNLRVSYTQDPETGALSILEEAHYYPFGLQHTHYNSDLWGISRKEEQNTGGSGTDEKSVAQFSKHATRFANPGYNYKFNGMEMQEEFGTVFYDFGARNYDPALGRWMNIDPLTFIMRDNSPYNFAFNNPIYFSDFDGRSPKGMFDPYLVFNGCDNKIYIYDDNGTPNDTSDDILLGVFDAHNIVDSKAKGKWENGKYEMLDKNNRRIRTTLEGGKMEGLNILQDSWMGRYGEGGIYRAVSYTQANGVQRSGMAVHAGREHLAFLKRVTYGCIRTTCEAMVAIDNAIASYGPLQYIEIFDNFNSLQKFPTPETQTTENSSTLIDERRAPVSPVNHITPQPIAPDKSPDPGSLKPLPIPPPSGLTPGTIIIPPKPIDGF